MGLFLEWFTNPLNPQGRPSGVAGEQRDMSQAEWIKDLWVRRELDYVNVSWYSVLLSYPDPDHPNKVELLDNNREVLGLAGGDISG